MEFRREGVEVGAGSGTIVIQDQLVKEKGTTNALFTRWKDTTIKLKSSHIQG